MKAENLSIYRLLVAQPQRFVYGPAVFGSEVAIFLVGCLAGFINVSAAGGSAISVPFLIFMGLSPHIANGTNRVPILIQYVVAFWGFRQHIPIDYKKAVWIGLVCVPGGILGVMLADTLSPQTLQVWIAIGMGIVLLSSFYTLSSQTASSPFRPWSALFWMSMALLGVYGGLIQIGIGFLFIGIMRLLTRSTLLEILAYKSIAIALFLIPTVATFIVYDQIHWPFAIAMTAGNSLGGWVATRVAVKKGEAFIKRILQVAILLLILRMLLPYLL